MAMDNALEYILQFSLTRSQIDLFTQKVMEEIDAGTQNPLSIHLCLKAMEEVVKKIKAGIADQVLLEAEKYGKSFEYMGARVQLSERRSYDFSNDSTWSEVSKTLKQREELLKHLTGPMADAETGEIILPPGVKITTIVAISLPQ